MPRKFGLKLPFGESGSPRIGGLIGGAGLGAWWLETFTERERATLNRAFQPFGGGGSGDLGPIKGMLTDGSPNSAMSPANLVSTLATWVNKPPTKTLAKKVALESLRFNGTILDCHFREQAIIQIFYPERDRDPQTLPIVIDACLRQISLSPQAAREFLKTPMNLPSGCRLPSHVGFEQLAIIYEKQKRFSDALEVSRRARAEGWCGSWAKRMERLQKKL